jgi:hypothetical protein
MVTRFGYGVVWAGAQSCAEKGKAFSIKRPKRAAKPIEISVCAIKTLKEKAFGNMQPFQAHFHRHRRP